MSKIFISYKRIDEAFVRQLDHALRDRGQETWVDLTGIPATAIFMDEIRLAIEQADAIIFVLSPESVISEVCGKEVEQALRHHKRLIPIVRREVTRDAIPGPLAERNWIFFRESDDFASAIEILIAAIAMNLDWVHTHTRLEVRAGEWDRGGRDRSFLFRGADLSEGEHALVRAGEGTEPQPTKLQQDYVLASRAEEERNQAEALRIARDVAESRKLASRRLQIGLVVSLALLTVAAGLGVAATWSRREAHRELALMLQTSAQEEFEERRADLGFPQLVRSLGVLPAGLPDQEHAARVQVASWGSSLPRLIARIDTPGRIKSACISPDGKLLLSLDDTGHLQSWDPETGRALVGPVATGLHGQSRLAFGPRGRQVLAISSDGVRLWSANALSPSAPSISFTPDPGPQVVLSPDESILLTASRMDDHVEVWDAYDGRRIATWKHSCGVAALAFSPDGTTVATGEIHGGVRLWDVRSGMPRVLQPHQGPVYHLAFSVVGDLLATGASDTDSTAHVYRVADGRMLGFLPHNFSVSGLKFSDDGRELFTSSRDQWIRRWDTTTGIRKAERWLGADLDTALFSRGGHVVLRDVNGYPQVVDRTTLSIETPPFPVATESLSLASERPRLVTVGRGSLLVWDLETIRSREILSIGEGSRLSRFKISPDGRSLAAFNQNSSLELYRLQEAGPELIARIVPGFVEEKAPGMIPLVDFSADSETLVTGSVKPFRTSPGGMFEDQPFGRLEIWSTRDGKPSSNPSDHSFTITNVASHPSSSRFVVVGSVQGEGRGVVLRANPNLEILREFRSDARINQVKFSTDGLRFATESSLGAGQESVLQLWNLDEAVTIGEPMLHQGPVSEFEFSPDGRWIASASYDNSARIWDARTGRAVTAPLAHAGVVESLAFNAASTQLLTGSRDHTAQLWGLPGGQPIADPLRHGFEVQGVAFDRSGRIALTSTNDGNVHLWDVRTGSRVGWPASVKNFGASKTYKVTVSRDNSSFYVNTNGPIKEFAMPGPSSLALHDIESWSRAVADFSVEASTRRPSESRSIFLK